RTEVSKRAGLRTPVGGWQDMVDAGCVNALNRAVLAEFGCDRATSIARDAGHRTGRYILEHRIPNLAQSALVRLPKRLAVRLLLKAIEKNAWTFAGSARVEVGADWIAIHDNPVCMGRLGYAGCVWHEAVLATLFSRIAGRGVASRETHCVGSGNPYCRFEITLG
ncbi:MAG: bacteriochlorophyll 4-vinyl reductase, partial [Pseudomonadota bacterium]